MDCGRGSDRKTENRAGLRSAAWFSFLAENSGVSNLFCPVNIGQILFILGIQSKEASVSQVFGYPKLAHVLYCLFPLII